MTEMTTKKIKIPSKSPKTETVQTILAFAHAYDAIVFDSTKKIVIDHLMN